MTIPFSSSRLDEISRRRFIASAAASLLGVSISPQLQSAPVRVRPARRVISLFMSGGMPQLESFAPCPDAPAEIRGETRTINSNADGVRLAHYLSRTAKFMDRAVVFRTLGTNQGAHAEGRYFMKTNWRKRGTIQHPHLGSWTGRLAERLNPELPGFVSVTSLAKEVGAGFLGAEFEPLIVRDPEKGLANTALRHNDSPEAMAHRLDLARKLNAKFEMTYTGKEVSDFGATFEATSKLMQSDDLQAFDISADSPTRRKLYGSSRFGIGCLLARRLSASGVKYVEVELGGWDTHTDHFKRAPALLNDLDRGLSALLEDLAATGELDETLVTVTTEFGRTPEINRNEGRDHFPNAFAGLIAGGGINGGKVIGQIDPTGREVEADPVDVTAFNATIGWALGLPVKEEIRSPSKRPFAFANDAEPLTDLFPS